MAIRTLLTRGRLAVVVIVLIGLAAAGRLWFGRLVVADSETATVTRGVYTDIVEIRGQVQPVRSTLVTGSKEALTARAALRPTSRGRRSPFAAGRRRVAGRTSRPSCGAGRFRCVPSGRATGRA